MANNIALFKQHVTFLDEVYKISSLTAGLDGAAELVREGANANELVIPMISMDGLADYNRNSGYVDGDVTLTNETVACNFDRGRMFNVDVMDDVETAGIAFGRLAGEFERTKVVPEMDAFRLSKYASKEGISTVAGADLTTGAQVIEALRKATNKMDEDEVPTEGRTLFITPTLYGLVEDLDTTKSKAVLARFSTIIQVPQTRFYTEINQTGNGYTKAEGAANINFLIVHKDAPIQYVKHLAPKVITPENNQNADGWKFGYRCVAIADVYENKLAGIYLHKATN